MKTILLAEEDEAVIARIRSVLSEIEVEVVVCHTAMDVLDRMTASHPEILIVPALLRERADVDDRVSGFRLLDRIREADEENTSEIILLTTGPGQADIREGYRTGVTTFQYAGSEFIGSDMFRREMLAYVRLLLRGPREDVGSPGTELEFAL